MNIYVGNVSYQTDDSRLVELFSEFGEVDGSKLIFIKLSIFCLFILRARKIKLSGQNN